MGYPYQESSDLQAHSASLPWPSCPINWFSPKSMACPTVFAIHRLSEANSFTDCPCAGSYLLGRGTSSLKTTSQESIGETHLWFAEVGLQKENKNMGWVYPLELCKFSSEGKTWRLRTTLIPVRPLSCSLCRTHPARRKRYRTARLRPLS